MGYYIYDSDGYVGDLCSNNGLNELKEVMGKNKILASLFEHGSIDTSDEVDSALNEIDTDDDTVSNFADLARKCKDIIIITDGVFDEDTEKSVKKKPVILDYLRSGELGRPRK